MRPDLRLPCRRFLSLASSSSPLRLIHAFVLCVLVAGTGDVRTAEGQVPSPMLTIETPPSSEGRIVQNRGVGRFFRWAYRDAGALGRSMIDDAPYYLVLGTGLTVAAQADAPLQAGVETAYRESPPVATALDVANLLGEREVLAPVAGVFVVSLATDNHRLQDAAFTSLQSLLYASTITNVLKGVVGRHRPDTGSHPFQAAPGSGHTAFPSGHTTTAFAVLTPWILYYPNRVTYSLFAVSSGTAIARVALERHWPTDVIAGAAVGFFTARYLTRRHQGEALGSWPLHITPIVGTTRAGVSVRLSLP